MLRVTSHFVYTSLQFLAASLSIAYQLNRTLVEFKRAETDQHSEPWNNTLGQNLSTLKPPQDIPASALGSLPDPRIEAYPDIRVIHDHWLRAPSSLCKHEMFGCYMRPISSCFVETSSDGLHVDSVPLLDPRDVNQVSSHCADGLLEVWEPHSDYEMQAHRVVRINSMFTFKKALRSATHPKNIPEWFKNLAVSSGAPSTVYNWQSLWFPSFESFLFRPKKEIFDQFKEYAATKAFIRTLAGSQIENLRAATRDAPIAVVGAHFREGDVEHTGRGRLPIEHAFTLIGQLKRALTYNHIFLVIATNNAQLRRRVQRFHAVGVTAVALVYHDEALLELGTLERYLSASGNAKQAYSATLSIIQDVDLLSSTSFLVGACFSQVSRLAFELMVAKHHAQLPPVSVDWEDCRDASYHPYCMAIPWWPRFDTWMD
eukprot:gb/GECG01006887.1/.p1 GENE.gb/GECG01006887.1/~~gb/GECG01006887.1/.p1  ORF type:complete len:429 (+),score=19.01 gb/GECG01006887.1/:1-1287(+)